MDGHNGGPNYGGIFEKLGNLKAGAKIIIERGDGQKITYEVRDNRQMTVDEINNADNKWGMSTMLNSIEAGKEGLNIITCVGQWLQDSQTFNSRVMLRAVRTE
jgi:sortase (surface protein transpeptidase)